MFQVSKMSVDERISFHGCDIVQNVEGEMNLCMNRFMKQFEPINVDKVHWKMWNSKPTEEENQSYRKLADALMWLDSEIRPQPSCVSFFYIAVFSNVDNCETYFY